MITTILRSAIFAVKDPSAKSAKIVLLGNLVPFGSTDGRDGISDAAQSKGNEDEMGP